jgi:hypothetical protein
MWETSGIVGCAIDPLQQMIVGLVLQQTMSKQKLEGTQERLPPGTSTTRFQSHCRSCNRRSHRNCGLCQRRHIYRSHQHDCSLSFCDRRNRNVIETMRANTAGRCIQMSSVVFILSSLHSQMLLEGLGIAFSFINICFCCQTSVSLQWLTRQLCSKIFFSESRRFRS